MVLNNCPCLLWAQRRHLFLHSQTWWPGPECGNRDAESVASWPSLGRPGSLCLALLEGSGWGWVGSWRLALRPRCSRSRLLFTQHYIASQGAWGSRGSSLLARYQVVGGQENTAGNSPGGNGSGTSGNLEARLTCGCLLVWDAGNPLHPSSVQLSYPYRLVCWVLWRERKGLGPGLGQNAMETRDQLQEVGVNERQFSRSGELEQTFHRKVSISPDLWVSGYIDNRKCWFCCCCSLWDGSIEPSVIF